MRTHATISASLNRVALIAFHGVYGRFVSFVWRRSRVPLALVEQSLEDAPHRAFMDSDGLGDLLERLAVDTTQVNIPHPLWVLLERFRHACQFFAGPENLGGTWLLPIADRHSARLPDFQIGQAALAPHVAFFRPQCFARRVKNLVVRDPHQVASQFVGVGDIRQPPPSQDQGRPGALDEIDRVVPLSHTRMDGTANRAAQPFAVLVNHDRQRPGIAAAEGVEQSREALTGQHGLIG